MLCRDTIVEHPYNVHARYQQLFKLAATDDGGYIAVGTHRYVSSDEESGWPIGFMLKLDADLNEEWYRYYVPSIWEGLGRWNNLTDVVENENGTYTAVGLIYTNTGDGPQNGFIQDTYVLTVDSLGCLVEGCDVGISEFEYADALHLFPNPVNESVTIQFSTRDNWIVKILNTQGQLVVKKHLAHTSFVSLEISDLPAGFYLVNCSNSKGEILVRHLIKN